MVAQACATGARTIATAASEVEISGNRTILAITADRCSNGPHVYHPNPLGPGGTGDKEDIVLDSFANDPWARNSMTQTAENVAAEARITREEQDELTLVRFRQYQDALANDSAFLRRFMTLPLEVKDASGRKTVATLTTDEGVFATTKEAKAKGLTASHFSFNVPGGRCEACQGEGEVRVEMQFLADVFVPCDQCDGRRFKPQVLDVKYRGKNVHQVLQLMDDLRSANVDFLTIGQYLQPTRKHAPVKDFITPDAFKAYERIALAKGFLLASSSPLTRSSYHADADFARLQAARAAQRG